MPKPKISFLGRGLHFFTHHPWLKLVALALAVIAWLYVRGELGTFNY